MKLSGIFFVTLFVLFISSSTVAFAASNTDTLISYWKFDETVQGSNATDSSGDGHTATPFGTNGGPAISPNNLPTTTFPNTNSVSFNGSDQYFEVADNPDLNGSTFTISFWAKFNNINSTHQTLVGKWQVGVKQQYVVQLTDTNRIGFWTGDGGSGSSGALMSTFAPLEDTWYHITIIASGTNRTLYINGTDNKYTGTGTSPGSSDIELTIGSKKNGGGTYFEFLDGFIDDLRIYKRALSDAEVDELAAGDHTSATWDGSASSQYETTDNWDINAVPDNYTKVIVPQTIVNPILTSNITLASLTLNSGATFNENCYTVTYNDGGSLTNNGGTYIGCPSNTPRSEPLTPPGNTAQAPACTDQAPKDIPDLFQIDTAGTFATLYFTTVKGAKGYAISYGYDANANQFGSDMDYTGDSWIIDTTVWYLSPNTTYFMKVRAVNGCNAGEWSKVMEVKTKGRFSNITQFYNAMNPFKKLPQPTIVSSDVQGSNNNNCSYMVQEGDTLWSIAYNKFGDGKKYDQILKLNTEITDRSRIIVGQQLKVCE